MKRRGLSTVIGATFFVIVMGSTIGYVTYSIDLIDDLAREVDEEQDRKLNRLTEEFVIQNIGVDNNEFNLTVTNTGSLPINITKMWAQNMTDSTWNQTSYTINQVISPGATVIDIGQGTGLMSVAAQSYSLKLLTSRGNTEQVSTVAVGGGGGSGALEMTLVATPANPLSNQNVTLIYAVTNNLTGSTLSSVVPDFRPPTVTGSATAVQQGSPSPASVTGLIPGDTALFETTYFVTGGNTEQITFNATINNAVQGNFVRDTTEIDIAPVSESAINEILGGQVGVISMNFTTFEACKPEGSGQQDCTSDSSDWFRAWDLKKNERYLYRINITNSGVYPIIIEESTNLMQIAVTDGGSGSSAKPYFLREDSTPSVENPGYYIDLTKTLPANPNTSTIMYFGGKGTQDNQIASTDSNPGIVAVFVVLFGYEDKSPSGFGPEDTTYAQTIPFQAFRLTA